MDFLLENKSNKGIVVSFGRMNPPTIGHQKLINVILQEAKKRNYTPMLYLSHTHDNKKNPLSYKDKFRFIQRGIPEARKILQKSLANTPFQILDELNKKNISEIIFVVGSDRFNQFQTMFQKYQDLYHPKIYVISAGERDPDNEDVSGASASLAREYVVNGSFVRFQKLCPQGMSKDTKKEMYKKIQSGLGLKEQYIPVPKSLGIPRYKMPQIRPEHREKFLNLFRFSNIKIDQRKIKLSKLKYTQRELNKNNVINKINDIKIGKVVPLIVSKDNYVLDGHHSFHAACLMNKNATYPCIKISLNIEDLITAANTFPEIEYEEII